MHRLCLVLLFLSTPVFALEPLVNSAWLAANREMKNLFLLDIQQPEYYKRFHVPGAINAPYNLWRTDKQSKAPGMLPPIKRMEKFIGKLGINRNSKIVIIATGNQPGDMAAASRVFWTLRVMGHQNISVLNGGLANYANRFSGDLEAIPRFGMAAEYSATPDHSITTDITTIRNAIQGKAQLLDARTLGEYNGVIIAKPNERPGTIPSAKHIPFDWFVDRGGLIRDKQVAVTLFNFAGLNPSQDGTIHFCHTGNRAALTWFVDYAILGNKKAKLYDASMSEWAVQKELPIETKFDLKAMRQ